ncbi:uncharacterized protein LOC136771636 [Amia ocellicauda]|uniref:uncharacterized protein LOC136771636 n=1 Tax=Amia ocellicauda TaxID=2972642 RepID=UPI003463C0FB
MMMSALWALCVAWTLLVSVDGQLTAGKINIINNELAYRYGHIQGQVAMAFNLPSSFCDNSSSGDLDNILKGNEESRVQNVLNKGDVYTDSIRLAAATPLKHNTCSDHAEYRLLYPAGNNYVTKLQRDSNTECMVFFSLLSPCTLKCLNNNRPGVSILESLQDFSFWKAGYKAFVFEKIYIHPYSPCNKEQQKLQLITQIHQNAHLIPFYRCDGNNCCNCASKPADQNNPCLADRLPAQC